MYMYITLHVTITSNLMILAFFNYFILLCIKFLHQSFFLSLLRS